MRLVRLSVISIVGCLAGLALLAAVVLAGLERLDQAQARTGELFELRERINDFSVASDSVLLYGADAELWAAYRADARALQAELRRVGGGNPDAQRAARQIGVILDALAVAGAPHDAAPGADGSAPGRGGPLALPQRGRIIMNQVAGHGIALDTALDSLLRGRQQMIAREAAWIGAALAGAALLFGILCVTAFGLIHRRIARPIRGLSGTIERIRAGDMDVRASVAGDDELAELSSAFNRLIDQRQDADGRLREREAELEQHGRMLAESQRIARVGGWRLQLADMHLEWTDETYRILGVEPGAFTPSREAFFAHLHPEDRDRVWAERDAMIAGQHSDDLEFRIVRADGEVRHMHECTEIERGPGGEVVSLTGTMQDVTERRRLEEHLHQFRRMMESSRDLFCIIDAEYRYTFANEAYAALYQLERSQIEGVYVADVVGKDFFERNTRPPIDRSLAGEPQVFEAERTYPHLGTRQLLIRYYPITSADGRVRQVGAVVTDVTDLKQAKAELREQAHLIDIAGRVARLGGWAVELATNRITWSPVVAEIHGMAPGYAPGTPAEAFEFYAPEHRTRIRALFGACVGQGTAFDEELQIVDARGQHVWVRVVGEPVRAADGTITHVQGALQDISARKVAELERERLDERLRRTLESISEAFYTLDAEWHFNYVNTEAEELLQRPRAELLGRNVWVEFPEAVGTEIEEAFQRAMREGVTVALEEYYPPLGTWFDIRAHPSSEGLAVFFRDVTERHEMLEQLRAQEASLKASRDELEDALATRQALINALPAHIALLDGDGNILDVNDRWRQFGHENRYPHADYGVGRDYLAICEAATGDAAADGLQARDGLRAVLTGERDTFALEYACHSPDAVRWFRVMANRLGPGRSPAGEPGAVVMHVDITERKLAEQELNRLAYEDRMTGLPSRHGFVRTVGERIDEAGWQPGAMVVMLDIRQLRDINDAHGYAAGDQLLAQIAHRLGERAGDGAIVGRIGGDEFALFLPERRDRSPVEQRAAVTGAFTEPFELDPLAVEASATYGYTFLDQQPRAVEDLLREAELALFQVRGDDSGESWATYTSGLHEQSRERIAVTRDLRRALERDEFQLHFQPKVRLDSGEMVSGEALLRWLHPEHGLQSPARFIPVAERSQLIGPIGDWVIDEACRRLRQWQDEGLDIVRVAVNVSLVQFIVGDITETVYAAIERHRIGPGALTLEITESVFEQESESLRQQLRTLHDMGVRLSLDDFGTGYSSLLYLQKYPFDEIKVDQGFVQRMLDDTYSRKIVTTVLGIAGALGADAVAEGIETVAVRDALLEMGCRIGQGYYFSMPLEAEDFRWLVTQRSALPLAQGGGR